MPKISELSREEIRGLLALCREKPEQEKQDASEALCIIAQAIDDYPNFNGGLGPEIREVLNRLRDWSGCQCIPF